MFWRFENRDFEFLIEAGLCIDQESENVPELAKMIEAKIPPLSELSLTEIKNLTKAAGRLKNKYPELSKAIVKSYIDDPNPLIFGEIQLLI